VSTLADLAANPRNPRKISVAARDALRKSLAEFGDLSGFIFNRRSGHLVGAHQRKAILPPTAEVVISERVEIADSLGTELMVAAKTKTNNHKTMIQPELLPLSNPASRATMNGKPVHEVPAKSVLNLESGFAHKLLCDGPTFTMGSACAYSCTFCYVEDLMRKNPHWQGVIAEQPGAKFEDVVIRRRGGVAALCAQLTYADGRPRFMDDDQAGRVVYASPLVDVAANLELVRETIQACEAILTLTRWDIRLLSKSNLLPKVAQGIASELQGAAQRRIIYGVSTGTLDPGIARAFERGTPLVSKRLESLHWLQDHGYRTYGMLCPSLPLPDGDYEEFAEAMATAIRADLCEHVWGEVINVRGDSMTRTVDALNAGGFRRHAQSLTLVSTDKEAWETYAQVTFGAHAHRYSGQTGPDGKPKLRFLQYVTKNTRAWWKSREPDGAILL